MQILSFGNNVSGSLAEDITAEQTTIQVLQGEGLQFQQMLSTDYQNPTVPLTYYAKLTLTDDTQSAHEIIHLTAVVNDTLTVVRGQESTTRRGWNLGDFVGNMPTRGSENELVQIGHQQSAFYSCGTAGGSANALTLTLPSGFFRNGATEWELNTPLVVIPSQENTAACTLQITLGGVTIGTFPLYKGERDELDPGDILPGVPLLCLLNKSEEYVSVINPSAIYAILGTAAYRNVQVNRADRTAGRLAESQWVLQLANAIAGAQDQPNATVRDANDIPANSVGFIYSTANNAPPFTGSVLDFAGLFGGYRVQIAVSYNQQYPRIAIRSFNNDAAKRWTAWEMLFSPNFPPTAAQTGAVPVARRINGKPLNNDITINSLDVFGTATDLYQANLNNVTAPGVYYQAGNAQATAARNYPVAAAGALMVLRSTESFNGQPGCVQFYRAYNGEAFYSRSLNARGWTAWARYYSTLFRPSAVDVGAIPIGGSAGVTGPIRSTSEYQTTYPDNWRIVYNNRGQYWRFDGSNLYLMFTNQGNPYGGYNNLRPFYANWSNGNVSMSHAVTIGGGLQVGGGFNSNGNSSANQFIPRNYSNFDARYPLRSQVLDTLAKAGTGYWRNNNTGFIIQWGRVTRSSDATRVNFPLRFPAACINVQHTLLFTTGYHDQNAYTTGIDAAGFTYQAASGERDSLWMAMGY